MLNSGEIGSGDLRRAREYLANVVAWPAEDEPGYVALQWTVPNGKGGKYWYGRAVRSLDEAEKALKWALAQPNTLDIYACMSLQREAEEIVTKAGYKILGAKRCQGNALLLKSLFLDVDAKEGGYGNHQEVSAALGQFIQKIDLPRPSTMVNSGGGLHVYWTFDRALTPGEWLPLAQALVNAARDFGLKFDAGCTIDSARVLRVPDTFNHKLDTPRPVRLADTGPDYSVERLEQALAAYKVTVPSRLKPTSTIVLDPAVFPPRPPITEPSELSAGLEANLEEILSAVDAIHAAALADEGTWMRVARALAHHAWIYTSQAEDLYAILDEASQRAPGYDADENRIRWLRYIEEARRHENPITIGTLFHLAESHGWPDSPPATFTSQVTAHGTFGFVGTGSMRDGLNVSFSNIPHRRWLYGVDLVRGEITLLASPGGVGKSSLALGMAVCIATNRELLDERVWGQELKALYINAEDSALEMRRRFWAFCLKHNVAEQDLSRLSLLGADDWRVHRISFLRTEKGASVLDSAGIAFFELLLEELRPDLVILDPLIALSGGGNLNDNAAMSLVQRELKRLASRFDCAVLVLHHTRKGGDLSSAEAIGGASAIVNLARRAVMAVPMTLEEASELGLLPSQRAGFFKTVACKSNMAPRSHDAHWYQLCSVTLPNSDPPTYMFGDGVQAVARVTLPLLNNQPTPADELIVRRAILDTIDRGKMIDGQVYPYSPNVTGAKNERALLEDAIAAVASATAPRQWHPGDLRVVVDRTIKSLKSDGWLTERTIAGSGRFRRGGALHVDWDPTPWAEEHHASSATDEQTTTHPAVEEEV